VGAISIRDISAAEGEKMYGRIQVGEWSDGSGIGIPIAIANGAKPGPVVLVLASMHGDEMVGTEAARRLLSELDPVSMSGSVIACFAVNIPAFLLGTRVNGLEDPAGSNDLKRVLHTAQSGGSLTERIACFVRDELIPHCEYYIDLHSSARGSTNSPRAIVAGDTAKVDEDVRAKLDLLADACDFEYVFRAQAGQWKGMYFAPNYPIEENYGKAGIVLETGHAPSMEGVDVLIDGMRSILTKLEIVAGTFSRSVPIRLISRLVAVRANRGGMWLPEATIGDEIKEGDLLGRIVSFENDTLEEITAPVGGVCIKVATNATISTGVRAHVIAVPYED
jgi:predicted deacylase